MNIIIYSKIQLMCSVFSDFVQLFGILVGWMGEEAEGWGPWGGSWPNLAAVGQIFPPSLKERIPKGKPAATAWRVARGEEGGGVGGGGLEMLGSKKEGSGLCLDSEERRKAEFGCAMPSFFLRHLFKQDFWKVLSNKKSNFLKKL